MRQIRTDLALEARELAGEIRGIESREQMDDGFTVTRVSITTKAAAEAMGQPVGNYITLDAPGLREKDMRLNERVMHTLAGLIRELLSESGVGEGGNVLVIGLGNRFVTPDSLGPRVVENTLVTRHIIAHFPEQVDERLRDVCAFAPGVLGITGIETTEVVRGVVEHVKPAAVIAIDALASRRTERISTTIQLANTGIHPGSGIGNKRQGLTAETLGVPVLAMGVPTVVHAATVSQDAVSLMLSEMGAESEQDTEKLLALVEKVVNEKIGPLIVTPKEIDSIVADTASLVADAINLALHRLDISEIQQLIN